VAFESRRLRVLLPCGELTPICHGATFPGEQAPAIVCYRSFCGFSCDRFQSVPATCDGGLTIVHCGVFLSDVTQVQVRDVGPGLVDAAQLPLLRAQLEAQLREVEAAERAVREFREREAGE
jgi:hypothetical protein